MFLHFSRDNQKCRRSTSHRQSVRKKGRKPKNIHSVLRLRYTIYISLHKSFIINLIPFVVFSCYIFCWYEDLEGQNDFISWDQDSFEVTPTITCLLVLISYFKYTSMSQWQQLSRCFNNYQGYPMNL